KTLIRGFTRSPNRVSQIIGTIMLFFVVVVVVGGGAVGTFFAYRFLPEPINGAVLLLVLTACWLFWLMLPLLEFSVNEGLDLSKLMLFPLTPAELMLSLLF